MAFPSIPSINALINSSMSSLKAVPAKTSDITGLNLAPSVSSDKMFQSVSSSKKTSNVFGVWDTKQAVQELSGSTSSNSSTESVSRVPPANLNNLSNKTGIQVTTDLQYVNAVASVMASFSNIKQAALITADVLISGLIPSIVIPAPIMYAPIQNISQGSPAEGIVPGTMSVNDFSLMKNLFNGANGISNYNSCPNVANAFGYNSNILDPSALSAALAALAALLAKYDVGGVMNCTAQAQKSLTVQQRTSLSRTFSSNGSVVGMNDYYSNPYNRGVVVNPYLTLLTVGSNRQTTYDPVTQRPNNTFDDEDVSSSTDSLFSTLGVSDKSSVFTTKATKTTTNASITDSMSDDVYDRNALSSTQDGSGFDDYCFGGSGTNSLISSIPDSLFV